MTTAEHAPRDVEREVESLGPWFHNLHLPDGTQTCPRHTLGDFPSFKWAEIAPSLPARLDGWSVLDIGCNAGFYAIELALRGANVTAIDREDLYLRQARWAAARFGVTERIQFEKRDVYELAHVDEKYDLVLFLGVFYHLRHPLLALDAVSRLVRRMLVFQTLTMPGDAVQTAPDDLALEDRERLLDPGWPCMAFLENRVAGDPTNWWAPNAACVEAMLRTAGLRAIARPAHETWICTPDEQIPSCMWTWNEEELAAASGRRRPT